MPVQEYAADISGRCADALLILGKTLIEAQTIVRIVHVHIRQNLRLGKIDDVKDYFPHISAEAFAKFDQTGRIVKRLVQPGRHLEFGFAAFAHFVDRDFRRQFDQLRFADLSVDLEHT